MTTELVIAGAVVVLAATVILLIRRRPTPTDVRRDAPTFEGEPPSGSVSGLGALLRRKVDEGFWLVLEEELIAADVGVAAAAEIAGRARASGADDPVAARSAIRDALVGGFLESDRSLRRSGSPSVIVVVGVNGSGKTTTIAKLAANLMADGESALVAAADTFRAAAAEQMIEWGERLGFDVVRGGSGADPASVAFDGRSAAVARGSDILIVDTAGRLHSKQNLMDELRKIVRVLAQAGPIAETLLVLDGTTGQNGIAQARAFTEAVGVTGVALTKLDGTAKGGIAVSVEQDLGIPIKLIGVGEGPGDLLHFDPVPFVDQLLGET